MYVETVVGPDTVNTMPPNTLDALLDHGTVSPGTVEQGLDEARAAMKALQDARISLFDVTHQLQVEGVASFADFVGRTARRDRLQAKTACLGERTRCAEARLVKSGVRRSLGNAGEKSIS